LAVNAIDALVIKGEAFESHSAKTLPEDLKRQACFCIKLLIFCFLYVEELINKMTNGFQVVVIDRV